MGSGVGDNADKAYVAFRWRHRLGVVRHWQRALYLALAAVLIGSPALALLSAEQVLAQDDPLALADGQQDAADLASISFLDNAELPPTVGQPDFAVYIEETGHTLGGVFLDYWRPPAKTSCSALPSRRVSPHRMGSTPRSSSAECCNTCRAWFGPSSRSCGQCQ